jgi:hypothetical protein
MVQRKHYFCGEYRYRDEQRQGSGAKNKFKA